MKNTMDYLTIALPKVKLFSLSADLLAKAGYTAEGLSDKSRKLVIANEEKKIRFIVSKTADVPTYVEYGAADIGVIGKDTKLCVNHFSHNSGLIYDELVPVAEELGFMTSYDGMQIDL